MKARKGKPLDMFEEDARQVIENHLGVPVVQHDDNTLPRMPDLRIEYPDRPHAVVEVGRDVDRSRKQQAVALNQKMPYALPGLQFQWTAVVRPGTNVGKGIDDLRPLLAAAETAGRHRFGRRDHSFDPLDQALRRAGFDTAWAQVDQPSTAGRLWIIPQPMGWWEQPDDRIPQWCEELLARTTDIAPKLKGSGYQERHAFLFLDIEGSPEVASMLREPLGGPGAVPLPSRAPTLPDGIDRIWIRGVNRVIAWSPDLGWAEIS
jgi:hypothetical protein